MIILARLLHYLIILLLVLSILGSVYIGSSVAAFQTETPTPFDIVTPIPISTFTPSPKPITLRIFRDEDSLTFFVPGSNLWVSLSDFAIQVTTQSGEQVTRFLDRDYLAFLGMPFDNLTALTPMCFRLERELRARTMPQDCQGILQISQNLSNADVFWYDDISNQDRLIVLLRKSIPIGVCPPGQSRCDIDIPVSLFPTPTLTSTASPTFVPSTFTPTPIIPTTTPTLVPPTLTSTSTPSPTVQSIPTVKPTSTAQYRNSGEINYGDVFIGSLSAQAPLAFFTFHGATGDQITLEASSMTLGFDPAISLNSPTQQQLAISDNIPNSDAQVTITLERTGVYSILVSSETGIAGDFSISLFNDSVDCQASSTGGQVNLRSGPGTNFNSVQRLSAGTYAAIIGRTQGQDGFVWLKLEGDVWARSDVVDVNGICDHIPQLIATPTPSYTPTTSPAAQIAPEDARFNNPLNIALDNTVSVLDFVSYPGGDREDRVRWDITGMNSNSSLSGGQARLVISASCFGQNTDQVQFFTGGQTYSCGQTIVDQDVTFNSKTGSVVITAVGGEGTYVQWVLTGTATRTN